MLPSAWASTTRNEALAMPQHMETWHWGSCQKPFHIGELLPECWQISTKQRPNTGKWRVVTRWRDHLSLAIRPMSFRRLFVKTLTSQTPAAALSYWNINEPSDLKHPTTHRPQFSDNLPLWIYPSPAEKRPWESQPLLSTFSCAWRRIYTGWGKLLSLRPCVARLISAVSPVHLPYVFQ